MASPIPSSSPFTRSVVDSMRKIYPEALADKSFDNTGLLLEAPFDPSRRQKNSVLLAIDLTTAVADEAIKRRDSAIVAYHPIIFRGLKAITLDDTQQRSLLRLAQHGISVYSPHTAVDTVPGGMADWLCDVVTGTFQPVATQTHTASQSCNSKLYSVPTYPQAQAVPTAASADASQQIPHIRSTIHPSPAASIPEGFESAGAGRLVTFNEDQPLTTLIDHIGRGVGLPGVFPLRSRNRSRLTTFASVPSELSRQWKSDRESALQALHDSAKQGGSAMSPCAEAYQDGGVEVSVSEADRPVPIAVIGGTGLRELPGFTQVASLSISTPWGEPSSPITILHHQCKHNEKTVAVAFLSRHGAHHQIAPHEVPARANIAALRSIGVRSIIAFSAVGSLQEAIKPRDFVIPDQIIDRTKGVRPWTYFEGGIVAHVPFGDPFDEGIAKIVRECGHSLEGDGVVLHDRGTVVCMGKF
ncbi:hypothetical protein N7509_004461 [Penicillium cosmopolitanum]|uniref:Nucleoside phosphorylase domain-containing protein n=1 Tax=Penicillium cosmopolitanum TaxID=1131564 RepID=A0A9X0BCB2_9EURO|nr:uncharacterized protein N7509_004461 [Penicillium cosmopolitanum]KAJ5404590.1 hypothetical protein N7509_004461 [Penicillium cosmopolitanum]